MKKGKIALSFASPEKEKYFLFIYEVITWGKKEKKRCYSVVTCTPRFSNLNILSKDPKNLDGTTTQ
jgi:hypothetical protein